MNKPAKISRVLKHGWLVYVPNNETNYFNPMREAKIALNEKRVKLCKEHYAIHGIPDCPLCKVERSS